MSTAVELPQTGHRPARLARNYAVLVGGEILAKAATYVAFSYLGHTLGPERYGSLEYAAAVMMFFALPVDLGLGTYGAREIARNRRDARTLLRDVALLRALLAAVSFLALVSLQGVLAHDAETRRLLLCYGLSLFGAPALLEWYFQGHDLMHWVAVGSIVRKAAFALPVFFWIDAASPLYRVGVCECLSVAATIGVCVAMLQGVPAAPWPRVWSGGELVHRLRSAAPIGLSELAWACIWYSPTVLLGLLVSDASLGWFGASHRIVMALHTFVWLYFFNLLPALSRCAHEPPGRLQELLHRSLVPAAWGSLFVVLVTLTLAPQVLALMFGREFAGAANVLAVLIWVIPVTLVSGHYRYGLIACGLQRAEFRCTVLAAAAGLGTALLLVPLWDAPGAAVALLAANLVHFALAYGRFCCVVADVACFRQIARPLLALGAAWGLYRLLAATNLPAAVGLAVLTYLGAGLLCERRQLLAARASARESV